MPAEHDDLILQVGPGDLGDGVEGVDVVLGLDGQVEGDLGSFALADHPDQAVVMLLGDGDLREELGGVLVPGRDPTGAGVGGRLARAAGPSGTVAWATKRVPPSPLLLTSRMAVAPSSIANIIFFRWSCIRARCSGVIWPRPPGGLRRGGGVGRGAAVGAAGALAATGPVGGVAGVARVPRPASLAGARRAAGSAALASSSNSLSVSRVPSGSKWASTSAGGLTQDEGSLELPLELVEVGLGLDRVEVDDLADDRAGHAGRPGLGEGDQGDALGLDDLHREPLERPPLAERAPLLEVGVLQAPARQLFLGPLVGPLHVRRGRQARADHVGQVAQGGHHLRLVQGLRP